MSKTRNGQPVLRATGLHKTYTMGGRPLPVLQGVDLRVSPGEWVAVLGASGCGKSTLLHLLGGLDRPTQGQVHFDGTSLYNQSRAGLDRYRRHEVGFVFQFYHLLPELTALDNVMIAGMVAHQALGWLKNKRAYRQRAEQLLEQFGLKERLKHKPNKLSGGERQRVAIARALINQPTVLLADEPTGNLDADTGGQILQVLKSLHQQGQTIVMVTHDARIAADADRQLRLDHGRLAAR